MSSDSNEKPKIFVDDDWKTQAQEEKDRLAAEEAAKKSKTSPEGTGAGEGGEEPREIPPASFLTLINSIAMQAMMSLGGYEDPETHQRLVDLGVAKFHIDTLGVLKEKTKGNLTGEESKLLDQIVYEMRMNFVAITDHIMKQQGGAGAIPPQTLRGKP